MSTSAASDLDRLFYPRGIAVIGASDDYARGSSMFLRCLIDLGYPGGLYPVNTSGNATAMGQLFYKKVTDIPGPVDYAIVGDPAANEGLHFGDNPAAIATRMLDKFFAGSSAGEIREAVESFLKTYISTKGGAA